MSIMAEVLEKLSRDIVKYDPLPVGMYQATVRGLPELKPIGGKQTPAAVFTMTGFVPLQSIDPGGKLRRPCNTRNVVDVLSHGRGTLAVEKISR